jgi:hypothetical protein
MDLWIYGFMDLWKITNFLNNPEINFLGCFTYQFQHKGIL